MGQIAHLASMSESGTGFQPVTCCSHSQDGCAPLVSTGGAPLYQATILGDFQRRASSRMILKLAPLGSVPSRPPSRPEEGGGMGVGLPSPKGFRPPAQGRPNGMRPTLGMRGVTIEPQSGSGRDAWENGVWGATPLGLKRFVGFGPKVAVWRPQPWAGDRERRRRREAAVPTRRRGNRGRD